MFKSFKKRFAEYWRKYCEFCNRWQLNRCRCVPDLNVNQSCQKPNEGG